MSTKKENEGSDLQNRPKKRNLGQLGKRLISSAVLVSATVGTIFWAPLWIFALVVEAIVLFALNEFLVLSKNMGIPTNRKLVLLTGALLPLGALMSHGAAFLVLGCVFIFVAQFIKKSLDRALISISVSVFALVYIVWFFSHLIWIRQLDNGPCWVFYIILAVKGGDAGAYFIGSKYGNNKLIEHISPNKSIEGAVGGFATTLILSVLSMTYLRGISFSEMLLLGSLIGVISQLGDLAESLIKRDAGVKDSGQVPGLGGIFDVLDSLLLTIPLVFYYLIIIGIR